MTDPKLLIQQLKSGTPSILIVDDDPHIISGLKDILEDSGYAVEVATCAEEARDVLRRKTVCAMITDYSLPDNNGIDLAHESKKRYPLLGLILMTGHHPDHIQEKIDATELKFLRKPVDVSVLLNAIEDILRHQCEALEVERVKNTVSVPLEFPVAAPLPPFPPSPILLQEPIALERRHWRMPVAWCGAVVVSFAIGWVSRASLHTSATPLEATAPVSSLPMETSVMTPAEPVTARAMDPLPQTAAPVVTEVKKKRPSFVSQLTHEDPVIRIRAAKAVLKKNPDHPKAIATLAAFIADPLSKQRLVAIEALSTAGASTPEAVSTLARSLSDNDPSVAYAAATALGHLGKEARPALNELTQALNYNDGAFPSVTLAARRALDNIGEPPPSATTPAAVVSHSTAPAPEPSTGLEDLPEPDPTQSAAAPTPPNLSPTR